MLSCSPIRARSLTHASTFVLHACVLVCSFVLSVASSAIKNTAFISCNPTSEKKFVLCAFSARSLTLLSCILAQFLVYQDLETGQRPPFYRSKIFLIILAILVVAIVGITLGVVLTREKPKAPSAGALAAAISIEDIMNTLEQLEAIAVNNSNNRALGTTGYAASVALVKQILAGFPALQIEEQTFVVPYSTYVGIPTLAQTQPNNVTFTYSVDYLPLSPSMGSGTFVARLESVANLGCNASDFAGFTAGRIALILRGNCTFQDKVSNALAAGAVAAVIYNDGADASRTAPYAHTHAYTLARTRSD